MYGGEMNRAYYIWYNGEGVHSQHWSSMRGSWRLCRIWIGQAKTTQSIRYEARHINLKSSLSCRAWQRRRRWQCWQFVCKRNAKHAQCTHTAQLNGEICCAHTGPANNNTMCRIGESTSAHICDTRTQKPTTAWAHAKQKEKKTNQRAENRRSWREKKWLYWK